jgi:hypothetical protein
MIVAGVRRRKSPAGGDPGEVNLTELGQEQRGDLVDVRRQGLGASAAFAVIGAGGGVAVVYEVRQSAGERAVLRTLVRVPHIGDVPLQVSQ